MSGNLKEFLLEHISRGGPMDIGMFMAYSLGHPQFGYYMQRDPFGVAGDFTTAPEISQMFGELIGIWAADTWMKMGMPEFVLAEGGPGRGTLMSDILRATRHMPGFHAAAHIHLVETSPVLQKMQAETLKDYDVSWHSTIDQFPGDKPVIFIANELLDALPIRQLQKTSEGWKEVALYNKSGELVLGLRDFPQKLPMDAPAGAIYEFSPARDAFTIRLCQILKEQGGAALLVDYGFDAPSFGSSLHVIYDHQHVGILDHIGEADVSANVNFSAIKAIGHAQGVNVHGAIEQSAFLKNMGIEQRAEKLKKSADPDQAADIQNALQRLTSSDEMGRLFKVIGLSHEPSLTLAGF